MKFNKTLIFVLAAITAVVVLFYLPKTQQEPEPSAPPQEETQSANVEVNFGEEEVTSREFPVSENSTAYSLLDEIAQEEALEIITEQYDFGIFVKSINGYKSSSERAWIYFVNGASGDIAADQKQIYAGDLVEWRYIAPNEE
jgi:LAS superfamily LD-carboxypeptidase LdcB